MHCLKQKTFYKFINLVQIQFCCHGLPKYAINIYCGWQDQELEFAGALRDGQLQKNWMESLPSTSPPPMLQKPREAIRKSSVWLPALLARCRGLSLPWFHPAQTAWGRVKVVADALDSNACWALPDRLVPLGNITIFILFKLSAFLLTQVCKQNFSTQISPDRTTCKGSKSSFAFIPRDSALFSEQYCFISKLLRVTWKQSDGENMHGMKALRSQF